MVSSLTSPSPVSVSARLSPWSSRAPLSNGNALNSDRCSKLEMKKEIAPASSSLKRILQGLDRQCISLGSVQERRLNPMHVLCSSSSTSSSPPARVSSLEDETSSSFVLLNVSLFCVCFWNPSIMRALVVYNRKRHPCLRIFEKSFLQFCDTFWQLALWEHDSQTWKQKIAIIFWFKIA